MQPQLIPNGAHSQKNGFGQIVLKITCFAPFLTQIALQNGRNQREISPTVKMGLRPSQ